GSEVAWKRRTPTASMHLPRLLAPHARADRAGRRSSATVASTWMTLVMALVAIAGFLALATAPAVACASVLDEVTARAQALAAKPYVAPKPATPRPANPAASAVDPNGALSYDQYRDIRFRPDRGLWHDATLPFDVQF